MTARLIIFLDDGGVLNDNRARGLQWQRLVGEYFVPLLGGSAESWSRANRVVANRLFEPDAWRKRIQAAADYRSFDRAYQVEWLRGMCVLVGIETPPEEECLRLAHHAAAFITRRVHAAFPGVVDTIRTLHLRAIRSIRPLVSPPSIWRATCRSWEYATVSVASMARI